MSLFERSLEGGPEKVILPAVCGRGFAVTERGISYTQRGARPGPVTVHLLDPATGKSREVSRNDRPLIGVNGLAISTDGGSILVSGSAQWGPDLFLVEHFR